MPHPDILAKAWGNGLELVYHQAWTAVAGGRWAQPRAGPGIVRSVAAPRDGVRFVADSGRVARSAFA